MGKNRVPEATTFALEMLRASLVQMPAPFGLDGIWQHFDTQDGNQLIRSVYLRVRIRGVDAEINAACNLYTTEGVWDWGSCTIALSDMPGRSWHFTCRRKGNKMVATAPQPNAPLEDEIRGLYGYHEPDINGGLPFTYTWPALVKLRQYAKQNPQRAYELAQELGCTEALATTSR